MFIKAALIRVALIGIAFIGLTLLFSCNEPRKAESIKMDWYKLSGEGLQGNHAKGVSAAYAALIDGQLIVAGGANFPDKLGFEGGAKVFYDEILWYDPTNNSWKIIGKLPVPSAYGVSIPIPHGALWIGGNDPTLTEEEKRQRNNAFSSTYMTQPISYYRFNPECRLFDTKTGKWITIDSIPHTACAGATLVWDEAPAAACKENG